MMDDNVEFCKDVIYCKNCDKGILEKAEYPVDYPFDVTHYICPKCDSTYALAMFSELEFEDRQILKYIEVIAEGNKFTEQKRPKFPFECVNCGKFFRDKHPLVSNGNDSCGIEKKELFCCSACEDNYPLRLQIENSPRSGE